MLNDCKRIQAGNLQDQNQILGYLKSFSSSIGINFFFVLNSLLIFNFFLFRNKGCT